MPHHHATEALFDDWAGRGRAEGMERSHKRRGLQALRQIPIAPGQRMLDLGCGNGWATRWMRAQAGDGGSAIGVDVAAVMLQRARLVPVDGVSYRRHAFDDLPFRDASFDHIFSMEALYYAPALNPALVSAARVLKPGGTLTICVDHYKENPHSASWSADLGVPLIRLSESGWKRALEDVGFAVDARFRCLDDTPIDPATPEPRRSAKLDFMANIGSLAIRASHPGSQSASTLCDASTGARGV